MNGMDSARINRTVAAESARLAPIVRCITGKETRDEMMEVFGNVAGRFALGKYDLSEFRGIVDELIRDAAGMAAQQDYDAAWVTVGKSESAPVKKRGRRAPWATWPKDGSARMGRAERIFVAIPMLLSAMVVLWVMLLPGMHGGSSAPVPTPDTALSVGTAVAEERQGGRFATPRITLDVNDLPSSDCWYEVTLTDPDGMAGGVKVAHVEPLCP